MVKNTSRGLPPGSLFRAKCLEMDIKQDMEESFIEDKDDIPEIPEDIDSHL